MVKKKVIGKKKTINSSIFFWIILGIGVVILGGIFLTQKPNVVPLTTHIELITPTRFNFANLKTTLNNEELIFINGVYENSDKTYGQHTARISNQSKNPSGTRAAAILIDSPGGSGTFFYLIGASVENGTEIYSVPVSLGDRIKIVSLNVEDAGEEDNGIITVKYLDRSTNVSMATEPTEEVTKKFAFQDDGNLIVILH